MKSYQKTLSYVKNNYTKTSLYSTHPEVHNEDQYDQLNLENLLMMESIIKMELDIKKSKDYPVISFF